MLSHSYCIIELGGSASYWSIYHDNWSFRLTSESRYIFACFSFFRWITESWPHGNLPITQVETDISLFYYRYSLLCTYLWRYCANKAYNRRPNYWRSADCVSSIRIFCDQYRIGFFLSTAKLVIATHLVYIDRRQEFSYFLVIQHINSGFFFNYFCAIFVIAFY